MCPLRENKPYLGLCLGAQMLAKHLGARVWEHPEGRAEIGYYPLVPTAAGEAVERTMGHALAEPRLSLASGGVRLSVGRRYAGDGRRFSHPGDPRGPVRFRPAVPPGSDPRDDLPLDRCGGRTPCDAGRAGSHAADRRTLSLRPPCGALARPFLDPWLDRTAGADRRRLPEPSGRVEFEGRHAPLHFVDDQRMHQGRRRALRAGEPSRTGGN